MTSATVAVGPLLRDWRRRRRLSQLDLALEAGVSARHLSFLETGRARPSRDMVLNLAEHLDVPFRSRNELLLAAGFAPAYPLRDFDAPELEPVRDAVQLLLDAHEPCPALVVDAHWGLVAANRAAALLIEDVEPELLAPPLNVLRVTLHPGGLARRITNLPELRAHLLAALARQAALAGDDALVALHEELSAYPAPEPTAPPDPTAVAVPLRLLVDGVELSFFTTIATFGTAVDVTVSELAIETFLPADAATRAALEDRAALPAG